MAPHDPHIAWNGIEQIIATWGKSQCAGMLTELLDFQASDAGAFLGRQIIDAADDCVDRMRLLATDPNGQLSAAIECGSLNAFDLMSRPAFGFKEILEKRIMEIDKSDADDKA